VEQLGSAGLPRVVRHVTELGAQFPIFELDLRDDSRLLCDRIILDRAAEELDQGDLSALVPGDDERARDGGCGASKSAIFLAAIEQCFLADEIILTISRHPLLLVNALNRIRYIGRGGAGHRE